MNKTRPTKPDFVATFRRAQEALGLVHYHVHFEESGKLDSLADISTGAEDCVAKVRYNQAMMEKHGVVESTAVHECLHLLLADFEHALEDNPRGAQIENERVVRRLEPLMAKAMGIEDLTPARGNENRNRNKSRRG